MKKQLNIPVTVILVIAAFLVGAWISYRFADSGNSSARKKVLYYVDPMHPSYRSDKPGIAPDCGMQLEPVYADGSKGSSSQNTDRLPPGTVRLSPERQQFIGVTVLPVETVPGRQMLRLTGRVAADETSVYVLNATIDGWITKVTSVTTGSFVKNEQTLATFYSPEFLSAGTALLYALSSMDRVQLVGGDAPLNQVQKDQLTQFNVSLQQYKDSLRNLGMGRRQIEEMVNTRKFTEHIDITAPGDGIVLARNISYGQRFTKGQEFFRIADLSRVWVLVDTYGTEVNQFKPGQKVTVSLPNRGKTYTARVSSVPPQFDPTSRTLKVRLEVHNPGLILRPDMFVDVELSSTLPPMLSAPVEAVLDSGLKKTVYVEKSPGLFEPREVETGRTVGGRIEIVSGLREGERVAASGTFLLDSESRMRSSAAGIAGTPRQDPVCGMYVDEAKARAAGLTVESGGATYYFCSPEDRNRFLKNPAAKKSMEGMPETAAPAAMKTHEGHNGHAMPPPPAGMADKHAGHQTPMGMSTDKPKKTPPPTPPASTSLRGMDMKHD